MNRRDAVSSLLALGAGAVPMTPRAQNDGRKRSIRVVINSKQPPPEAEWAKAYTARQRARFAAYGWIVGRNLTIENVFTGGDPGRIPALVEDAVRAKVDLIYAMTTAVAVGAARATRSIPIVLAGATAYPVECGLIESFAKPRSNVTGVAFFQGIEMQSKVVQLLRELVPQARRLGWIACPADLVTVAGGEFRLQSYYEALAGRLGLELGYRECRTPEDLDAAFPSLREWKADIVGVEPAGLSVDHAARIGALALRERLPTGFTYSPNTRAGGLLSYGPDYEAILDQTARYVDRILRGAQPADLPVELPNKLELAINLKTARALDLEIPRSVLLRADQVIE